MTRVTDAIAAIDETHLPDVGNHVRLSLHMDLEYAWDQVPVEARAGIENDLALGGWRPFKALQNAETVRRSAFRILLLTYRLLSRHGSEQTAAFRRQYGSRSLRWIQVMITAHWSQGQRYGDAATFLRCSAEECGGRLVRYHDQSDDPRKGRLDITRNGWCLGMSVQWLAHRAAGDDFWAFHDTERAVGAYQFLMAAQELRAESFRGAIATDRASFALKRKGLRMDVCPERIGVAATPEALADLVVQSEGGPFCRIGQNKRDGGAHAMAAYVHPRGVDFLDPNAGELSFPSRAAFRSWLPRYAAHRRWSMLRHYVEHYSAE